MCCGEYVPEGTMVCISCWKRYMEGEDDDNNWIQENLDKK